MVSLYKKGLEGMDCLRIEEGKIVDLSTIPNDISTFTGGKNSYLIIPGTIKDSRSIRVFGYLKVIVNSDLVAIKAYDDTFIDSIDSSIFIYAYDNVFVKAGKRSSVVLHGNSFGMIFDLAEVILYDSSAASACRGVSVRTYDRSFVYAEEFTFVNAYDESFVVGEDRVYVVASDKTKISLSDTALVEVGKGQPTIILSANSFATIRGGHPSVMAFDDSFVSISSTIDNLYLVDNAIAKVKTWDTNDILRPGKESIQVDVDRKFSFLFPFTEGQKVKMYMLTKGNTVSYTPYLSVANCYRSLFKYNIVKDVDIEMNLYQVDLIDACIVRLIAKNAFVIENKYTGHIEWFGAAENETDAISRCRNIEADNDSFDIHRIKPEQLEMIEAFYSDVSSNDALMYFAIVKKVNANEFITREEAEFLFKESDCNGRFEIERFFWDFPFNYNSVSLGDDYFITTFDSKRFLVGQNEEDTKTRKAINLEEV